MSTHPTPSTFICLKKGKNFELKSIAYWFAIWDVQRVEWLYTKELSFSHVLVIPPAQLCVFVLTT